MMYHHMEKEDQISIKKYLLILLICKVKLKTMQLQEELRNKNMKLTVINSFNNNN